MDYYGNNDFRDYRKTNDHLAHHGILGMKWGKKNGPPYPLGAADHSASEKKAGWRKSLAGYVESREAKKLAKEIKSLSKVTTDKAFTERKIKSKNFSKDVDNLREAAWDMADAEYAYKQESEKFLKSKAVQKYLEPAFELDRKTWDPDHKMPADEIKESLEWFKDNTTSDYVRPAITKVVLSSKDRNKEVMAYKQSVDYYATTVRWYNQECQKIIDRSLGEYANKTISERNRVSTIGEEYIKKLKWETGVKESPDNAWKYYPEISNYCEEKYGTNTLDDIHDAVKWKKK